MVRAIALFRAREGAPSKLCLSRSAKRPDACARLEGYVPALSASRSTATRFLLGRPHPLHNDGPARPTRPSISSPALRFAIGRATGGMTPRAKARHLFGALASTTEVVALPKTSSNRREVIGEGRMPSRQPARCRRYLSIASFLSTVLISRLLHRYQQAIER